VDQTAKGRPMEIDSTPGVVIEAGVEKAAGII
jgi:hypothetical protein